MSIFDRHLKAIFNRDEYDSITVKSGSLKGQIIRCQWFEGHATAKIDRIEVGIVEPSFMSAKSLIEGLKDNDLILKDERTYEVKRIKPLKLGRVSVSLEPKLDGVENEDSRIRNWYKRT